jgi:putative tryptophan/tyrosine transport system substrate-binding protein
MIDRRRFIGVVAAGAATTLGPAIGQSPGKVWRLGFLSTGSQPAPGVADPADAFWQRLRELGYVEGANLVVERRFAEAKLERLPDLAAQIVRFNPDLIVTRASPANLAAKNASATIPIVMATSQDPVREGVVASQARPGGNVTGMMFANTAGTIGKRLQLLKEAIPGISRLAFLPGSPPSATPNPGSIIYRKDTEEAAKAIGLQLQIVWVEDPSRWRDAFATMVGGRADAAFFTESPSYIFHAKQIAELALEHRMPTMFGAREHVEAGGLMSYGLSIPAVFRRAAEMVDKVLRGAKPADMPIEQPTMYELAINLATAKALGLTIPPSLRLRADQVIE